MPVGDDSALMRKAFATVLERDSVRGCCGAVVGFGSGGIFLCGGTPGKGAKSGDFKGGIPR